MLNRLLPLLIASVVPLAAQTPKAGRGQGGPRPLPAVVRALDVNSDGILDAREIEVAPRLLLSLDLDRDGLVSQVEALGGSNRRPGGGKSGGRRPSPPLVTALDTDRDGVISARELANAVASIQSLDKDRDGELSREEFGGGRRPGGGPGMMPGGGGMTGRRRGSGPGREPKVTIQVEEYVGPSQGPGGKGANVPGN